MHESGGERGTCRDRVSYTRLKEISRWSIVHVRDPQKERHLNRAWSSLAKYRYSLVTE